MEVSGLIPYESGGAFFGETMALLGGSSDLISGFCTHGDCKSPVIAHGDSKSPT